MPDSPNHPIHLEDRKSNGARKFSPTAARNREPIAQVLTSLLPQETRVLEIASGTGEQALHICQQRSDIIWQPSDPDDSSRASQDSWAEESGGNMRRALNIDTMQHGWDEAQALPQFAPNFIFCANMIHIAPWEAAAGLAKGAGRLLKSGSSCVLYGPFKEGTLTAPSNLEFDKSLKSRNPAWGVRDLDDVKHIFALNGFNLHQTIVMPKNNQILVFQRS